MRLVDERASAVPLGLFDDAVGRFEGGGHRFFEDDVATFAQRAPGVTLVESRGRGDDQYVGALLLPERFGSPVGPAAGSSGRLVETLGERSTTATSRKSGASLSALKCMDHPARPSPAIATLNFVAMGVFS